MIHSKKTLLEQLQAKMEDSWKELPLVSRMEDLIPGHGNPDAEILLIGEAGGKNEAEQRRPFIGMAGKLMTRELEKTGILRPDVWVSNVVKCRPPENRDPSPEEIAAFAKYLDQEISILNPKLIVTLGRFSMGKFLPEVKISQVHGKLYKVPFQGVIRYVLPFYHPSAAQRRKAVMADFMSDFAKLPQMLTIAKKRLQQDQLVIENDVAIEEVLV